MGSGFAWYEKDRARFLGDSVDAIVGQLSKAASSENLHVHDDQVHEWTASVGLLQEHLNRVARNVEVLKSTLAAPDLGDFQHVILEFDFRRRGLRMDCVLLGRGVICVVEFKRTEITHADREQVSNYCINLVEFHEETRRSCISDNCVVVPVVALTEGTCKRKRNFTIGFHNPPWSSVVGEPLTCDRITLQDALRDALRARRGAEQVSPKTWLASPFSPSSTIIDAAISLYGNHDVSAIKEHAADVELIEKCASEVLELILRSRDQKQSRIVFVSGAPGAGKTLVGLKLAFHPNLREHAVFVTGNAPLVEVLSKSLTRSYHKSSSRLAKSGRWISGYAREDASRVIENSTFKIVKAHSFLGERGKKTESSDGRFVIFDEAQRTYEKGRLVQRKPLEDDEAALILDSLTKSYGAGAVVVALIGHNQAINTGEVGIRAWFEAAKSRGWRFSISDETLGLSEITDRKGWAASPLRDTLEHGHLPHSMRFYRNREIELWADRVLSDKPHEAAEIAMRLDKTSNTIWLTRSLAEAKAWARSHRVGESTSGIIASAQGRRLGAEGLFVDFKPDISAWILEAARDIRSSGMLETVQNQYQIQGLELDFTIVCWDADLRRNGETWASYRISGSDWQRDSFLDVAKNGYRVLLTRARKGMILFVPRGDLTGEDRTREPEFYDAIAQFLLSAGARRWPETANGGEQAQRVQILR